jgi:beta-glucosidase
MSFPKDFVWGAAAASYQIEGASTADGKGLSVWDMFCRNPGRVADAHTGDIACDHYNRVDEDVAMMKAMGLRAYRLSISWPRLIPQGTGSVNPAGLAFYDKLINALLAAGITPWVTLFHWDYPHELYIRGGWLNPESPRWFADYTRVIVDRYSDRVQHWMTHNEPQCFIGLGLGTGIHAPGDKLGLPEVLRAAHHSLIAHGLAVQVIRAHAKLPPVIGWAPVGVCSQPATESAEDIAAAREHMFTIRPDDWSPVWNNTLWSDPVVLGHYPADLYTVHGKSMPTVTSAELATINQPLDFYGANIYNGQNVRAGASGKPEVVPHLPGRPRTHLAWPLTPTCLRWGTRFLYERYKLPIVITENGLASHDWVALDGAVHDPQRIDFTQRYLRELRQACADGVPIHGYFHWSLMDNFEWAEGYKYRFGLVHVDYATQKRTLKDSAHWYRHVIETNGASL